MGFDHHGMGLDVASYAEPSSLSFLDFSQVIQIHTFFIKTQM